MITGVSSIVVSSPDPSDLVSLLAGPFQLEAVPFEDPGTHISGHRIAAGDSSIETWTAAQGSHMEGVLESLGYGMAGLVFRGNVSETKVVLPWMDAAVVNKAIFGEPSEATHMALIGYRVEPEPELVRHPVVECIDHIVISSGDSAATAAQFAETFELPIKKRMARPGTNAHLEFMKVGQVVLEFGGPPEPRPGPHVAKFWGFVLTVWDIDATVAAIRDAGWPTTDPRPAVQPGARIAAVKERTSGVPFALIQYNAMPVE